MSELIKFYKWGINHKKDAISFVFFASTILVYLCYMMTALILSIEYGLYLVSGLMIIIPIAMGVKSSVEAYKDEKS